MTKLNIDNARVARARGWSYERIARSQGLSVTTVYYGLNKHKRKVGKRGRTIYVREEVWARVVAEARSRSVSASEIVAGILGERFGAGGEGEADE